MKRIISNQDELWATFKSNTNFRRHENLDGVHSINHRRMNAWSVRENVFRYNLIFSEIESVMTNEELLIS